MSKTNDPKSSLLKFKQKIQNHKFNPIPLPNASNKRPLAKTQLATDYPTESKRVKLNSSAGDATLTDCRPNFEEDTVVSRWTCLCNSPDWPSLAGEKRQESWRCETIDRAEDTDWLQVHWTGPSWVYLLGDRSHLLERSSVDERNIWQHEVLLSRLKRSVTESCEETSDLRSVSQYP